MLRDQIESDISEVFFQECDFAEKHRWNDREITCIADHDDLMARYSKEYEILPEDSLLVYAPYEEWDKKPKPSSVVKFDGVIYTIHEIKEYRGVYGIFLAKGRQNGY